MQPSVQVDHAIDELATQFVPNGTAASSFKITNSGALQLWLNDGTTAKPMTATRA